MRMTDDQVNEIKQHLKAGLASLSPEQILKFGLAMFAIGAVVAESALNGRERAIAERERSVKGRR